MNRENNAKGEKPSKKSQAQAKQEKLAAALRANLRRRKVALAADSEVEK